MLVWCLDVLVCWCVDVLMCGLVLVCGLLTRPSVSRIALPDGSHGAVLKMSSFMKKYPDRCVCCTVVVCERVMSQVMWEKI